MPPVRWCIYGLAALVLLLIAGASWAQHAPLTTQQSLAQMTREAETIVRGRVITAVVEKHPTLTNLGTVVVTLSVSETLKGTAQSTFTFREFLWDFRAREVPSQYRPGTELLLLMIRPSKYGLSSPSGLEQGTFRILPGADGQKVAVNGRNTIGLFSGAVEALSMKQAMLSTSAASTIQFNKPGPVRLQDLSEIVRRLAEVK
jgi:hypothetical protein